MASIKVSTSNSALQSRQAIRLGISVTWMLPQVPTLGQVELLKHTTWLWRVRIVKNGNVVRRPACFVLAAAGLLNTSSFFASPSKS
jgi:hypothetical protein